MAQLRAPSPRYRTDDPEPVIRLQEDDLEILWHVYCNRVIDAQSIYLLLSSRSVQGLSRRLNKLRKGPAPFLHRLAQAPNRLAQRNGSNPQAYALARRGADALRRFRGIDIPPQRWTQKNRELRPSTIHHDLATSRLMARLRWDAAATEGVELRYQQEIEGKLASRVTPRGGLKNTLRTKIVRWPGGAGEQGTAPDRIFELTASGRRHHFFLEMDAGTETIAPGAHRLRSPSFWRDTSLLRKFVVYASAFETKAHQEQFGINVFRTLVVTTSPSRMEAMQAACQEYLGHVRPGLFLFAHRDIFEHPRPAAYPFEDHTGREVVLV